MNTYVLLGSCANCLGIVSYEKRLQEGLIMIGRCRMKVIFFWMAGVNGQ